MNRHSPDSSKLAASVPTFHRLGNFRSSATTRQPRFWWFDVVWKAIWPSLPPFRRTSPTVFTLPPISSVGN